MALAGAASVVVGNKIVSIIDPLRDPEILTIALTQSSLPPRWHSLPSLHFYTLAAETWRDKIAQTWSRRKDSFCLSLVYFVSTGR